MRRKLAAAVLAAGMLAAAGCGGDGGRGTDELCDELDTSLDPLEQQLNTSMNEAGLAAGQGDDTALAEAVVELNGVVSEVTGAVREAADDASDEEFQAALESFADELEGLVGQLQAGTIPDTEAFQGAAQGVSQYCD
jgi:hypothetical protein